MSTVDEFMDQFVPYKPNFQLAEVAELTGYTVRWLSKECSRGRITHQWAGRRRVLTRPQIHKLLTETQVAEHSDAEPREDPRLTRTRQRVERLAQRGAV